MHTIRTVTWRGMTQERALAGALSGTLGTLLEGMLSELVRAKKHCHARLRNTTRNAPWHW